MGCTLLWCVGFCVQQERLPTLRSYGLQVYKPDKRVGGEKTNTKVYPATSAGLEAASFPHFPQEGDWRDCFTSRVSEEHSHGQLGAEDER